MSAAPTTGVTGPVGYPPAPPPPPPSLPYGSAPWHHPPHLHHHHHAHPLPHPHPQPLAHFGAGPHPGHHGPTPHMSHRQPPPPLTGSLGPLHGHGHGHGHGHVYYSPNPPLPSPGALSAPGSMGPPTSASTASPTYPGYPSQHAAPHVRHASSLPPPYLHPPHTSSTSSSASSMSLLQPVPNAAPAAAGSAGYPTARDARASSIPVDATYRPSLGPATTQLPSSAPSSSSAPRPRLVSPSDPNRGTASADTPSSSSSDPKSRDPSASADPSASSSSSSSPLTMADHKTVAVESTTDTSGTVTSISVAGRSLRSRRASPPSASHPPASTAVTTSRKRTAASRSPTRASARLRSTTPQPASSLSTPLAARTRRGTSQRAPSEPGAEPATGGADEGESGLDIEGDDPAPVGPAGRARASSRRAAAAATAVLPARDSPATSSLPDVPTSDHPTDAAFAPDTSMDPGTTPLLGHPVTAATATNDSALPTLGTAGYNLEVVCRREPYMYFVASNFTEVTSRNLKKRTAADVSAIHVDDRAGAIWVCFDIQRVYSEFDNLTMPCKQSLCALFRRALDGPEGPDAGVSIHGWAAIAAEASEVVRKTGEMVLARDLNRKAPPRRTGYVTVVESVGPSPIPPATTTRRTARVESRSPSPEIITSYKRRRVSGDRAAGSSSNGHSGHHRHHHHHYPQQSHDTLASGSASSGYHPYSRSSPPLRSINPPADPTTAFVMPSDTSVDYTQVLANEFSATLRRVTADLQVKYTELRNVCSALHAENTELRAANGGAPDTAVRELTAARDRIAKLEHENATLEARLREQAVTLDSVRKLLWAAGNRPDL